MLFLRFGMTMRITFHKRTLIKCLCCLMLIIGLLVLFICPLLRRFSNILVSTDIKNSDGKYYLCPTFWGRLGNNMFQYAAAYGIASEKNMTVLVAKDALIPNFFSIDGDILDSATPICSTFPLYDAPDWGIYKQSFSDEIPSHSGVRIRGYFQSYKYFRHEQDAIRKQFLSFSNDTITKAINILQEIQQYYFSKLKVNNVTLVGVHVRVGDRLNSHEVQLAPKEYFTNAMDYFKYKYNNSIFVVCGENQTWASENMSLGYNARFLNQSSSPDVDLAILAMCDHMILSIGSFSWWAAYLNAGEIIYYKDWITNESQLYTHYKHEDYFPPEWIAK